MDSTTLGFPLRRAGHAPARRGWHRECNDAYVVEGALRLWLQSLLKLLGHTDAEHLPLEPVLGCEFAKVVHVQRGSPRHVGQAKLPAHGVDLVTHTGVARITAGVVGDLPAAVPGKTDFEQE